MTREMQSIFNEVGASRFADGVDAIIRANPYQMFPTVAEFRGYIPEKAEKPYCEKCTAGWIYVPDYEARRFYQNDIAMSVVRCACRGNAKHWEPTEAERLNRSLYPENYFGYADLMVMVFARRRAQSEGHDMSIEEAWNLAMEARKLVKRAKEAKRSGTTDSMESVGSIIKRIGLGKLESRKKAEVDAAWKKWEAENPVPKVPE